MIISKHIFIKIAYLSMLVSPLANSAIALDRTRVIFDGSQKSITLNISNQNKQLPYLAQGWIENDAGAKIKSPLTILPPVQRIEPGKSSQVKIQGLPSIADLPKNKETLFYFNLREIPPKSEKPNTLQIALQTRVKLFYRPAAISIDPNDTPAQQKLTLTRQADKYILNNPTPYYVTIIDASNSMGKKGIEDFMPVMVPPQESVPLTVSATKLGSNPVLKYINDYGARPELIFSCKSNHCQVK